MPVDPGHADGTARGVLATPFAASVVVLVTVPYVQDVPGRRDIRVRSR